MTFFLTSNFGLDVSNPDQNRGWDASGHEEGTSSECSPVPGRLYQAGALPAGYRAHGWRIFSRRLQDAACVRATASAGDRSRHSSRPCLPAQQEAPVRRRAPGPQARQPHDCRLILPHPVHWLCSTLHECSHWTVPPPPPPLGLKHASPHYS